MRSSSELKTDELKTYVGLVELWVDELDTRVSVAIAEVDELEILQ